MHIKIDSVEMISAIEAKEGECDSIDFTHVLDLIEPAKTLDALRFLASKLRNLGTLTLSVTDFDLVCDQYKAGTGDPESMLCRDGMNRSIFNRGKLMDTLNMAGFEIIGGTDGRLGWTDLRHGNEARAANARVTDEGHSCAYVFAAHRLDGFIWANP